MKIGFLSVFNFGTNIGGVENHIYFMARALQRRGHQIVVFQPVESRNPKNQTKTVNGIEIRYIGIKSFALVKLLNRFNGFRLIGYGTAFLNKAKFILYRRRIVREVLAAKPDIIHQHDFISNIFSTRRLSKKIPCVLTNHTGEYLFFQKTKFGRFFLRRLLRHFKYIIGPSEELTPFDYSKNSCTIHNGVDLNLFNNNYNQDQVRRKYDFSSDQFIAFCPRRWAPTKGVLFLVKAIQKICLVRNIKFLFAGSDYDGYPKYRKEIMKNINQIDSNGNISLLGNLSISEIVDYYRLADVVIIPSLMEAVSLAAIEAMACGTPVISTNVGGMPELISDGVNGLLVEPADPSKLAEAIIRLNDDKKLYDKLVRKSLATAERYSWDYIAGKTEEIYKLALNKSPKSKISAAQPPKIKEKIEAE